MATPLYKRMKTNGTSFYCFPSSSNDLTLAFQSQIYKLNFSKFVLLNIPKQIHKADDALDKGILDFRYDEGAFYTNSVARAQEANFSEELVESLRNYVANYDTDIRESTDGYTLSTTKTSQPTDFFNFTELKKPTEMIFWKWLRKVNGIDFEPATHKVNWLKNDLDFNNPNGDTNFHSDYFREYLWKERDKNVYSISMVSNVATNVVELTINQKVKYRVNDIIVLTGSTISDFDNGRYIINSVVVNDTSSVLQITSSWSSSTAYPTTITIELEYNRLIQYIGEINAQSQVSTAKSNFTEITAYVPHQAGQTWDVLFKIVNNANYYPNLEIPILPQEIQDEIVGAENLDSPIRQNPDDYPGLWWGQFDSDNKTYRCSNGDRTRLQGDYYGINLSNNVGTDADNYFEKLSDFDSSDIDGVCIDFNTEHYLKMHPTDETSQSASNFDEFDSMIYDGQIPQDFEFNAVLWYYDMEDGTTDSNGNPNFATNLYGVTFLNNPMNDFDECQDPTYQKITTYKKFVSNENQDGFSYIFNLNLNFDIDNDMVPASFNPTSMNNIFGFDLYNNVMANLAKLNEQFMNVIDSFYKINTDMINIKSLVYSQTDLDLIKAKINNLEELLQLYSTNQIVDSGTVAVELDNSGTYPVVKLNVVNQEYSEIQIIQTSDILNYNIDNISSAVSSYGIDVPTSYKKLVIIQNDLTETASQDLSIILNTDLNNRQSVDFIIEPNISKMTGKIDINIVYNSETSAGSSIRNLVSGIDLPIDLTNDSNLTTQTFNRTYYSHSQICLPIDIISGITTTDGIKTILYFTQRNIFNSLESVYIDNMILENTLTGSILDLSGLYRIESTNYIDINESNPIYIVIDLQLPGTIVNDKVVSGQYKIKGYPKACSYKGVKITTLRVGGTGSAFEDRYKITKETY